jgi:hypothetical protein
MSTQFTQIGKASHFFPQQESAWIHCAIETKSILRSLKQGVDVKHQFSRLGDALQTLPISSEEFALMVNRSDNAKSYWLRGEKGAAVFELNLVFRYLLREIKCASSRTVMA